MNVVTIEADQLSAKWLGCYGCAAAHTPNLDALARRGVRFANAFSNHPVCMPARASTITGRSAQFHGVFYNGWELAADTPTFPRLLQAAGVQTFGVGKFHLECHARGAYNDVRKYGFDRAETTEDIRAGDWLDWVEQNHPDCAEAALATAWPMDCLASYGPRGRNLRREILAARTHLGVRVSATAPYVSPVPERACQTRWIGDRAIAFLRELRDPHRPFFLKMSFVDPHDPYDPPERFLGLIDEAKIPPPVRSEDPGVQTVVDCLRTNRFVGSHAALDEAQWLALRRHYLASLAFLDEQVGRLVSYLEAAGLADNTAILFFADHGDMMGDHGLPTKGSWHFDACCRIPLILAVPGEAEGKTVGQTVTNLDLFPTVLALADVPCSVPVEGDNLLPLLRGEPLDRPDAALVETYGSYGDVYGPFRARSAMTPAARLTRFEDGHGLLFDLADDPGETLNLYDQPAARDLQCAMEHTMLDLVTRQYRHLPRRQRHPTGGH
ncbi:MAG: sulfatase-like hydrolase/transferase [Lentisphaeria bacterium]|jgi:arylsulfatase A-like enzyme|nr:sulfatase-like hydrolase/transferase [Lentisphaeria bacterium]